MVRLGLGRGSPFSERDSRLERDDQRLRATVTGAAGTTGLAFASRPSVQAHFLAQLPRPGFDYFLVPALPG